MSQNNQFFIRVQGQSVPVTEEVYRAYYRSKRRDRYFEHDIKIETAVYDQAGNVTGYKPAKEDSLDRLMEAGNDYADGCESVEDTAICTIMADKLRKSLRLLNEEERDLIEALFFSNDGHGMTEQDYADKTGLSQQLVNARKQAILAKLKKFLEK